MKIKLLDGSNTEKELHEGDFFVLKPGVPYMTKNMADTKVLFVKSPAINDKTIIEIDDNAKQWLKSWD